MDDNQKCAGLKPFMQKAMNRVAPKELREQLFRNVLEALKTAKLMAKELKATSQNGEQDFTGCVTHTMGTITADIC
jgi:hypothetical protein